MAVVAREAQVQRDHLKMVLMLKIMVVAVEAAALLTRAVALLPGVLVRQVYA